MVRGGARLGYPFYFVQLTYAVDAIWESKSWIKIIEELFRNGLRHLVTSGVVLRGISCKAVHFEQNIIKPPLTLFQCRKWVDTISNGFIVVLFFIGALSTMRGFLCRMQLLLLLFGRGPYRVIETACFDAKVQ